MSIAKLDNSNLHVKDIMEDSSYEIIQPRL